SASREGHGKDGSAIPRRIGTYRRARRHWQRHSFAKKFSNFSTYLTPKPELDILTTYACCYLPLIQTVLDQSPIYPACLLRYSPVQQVCFKWFLLRPRASTSRFQ